jgi:hypothetical protein
MMLNHSHCVCAVVALLGCSVLSYADQTAAELAKEADVVVIGTPTAFRDGADSTTITLMVASSFSAPNGAVAGPIQVLWRASSALRVASRQAIAAGPGIWFLKRIGDNLFAPLPVRFPHTTEFRDLYFDTAADGACPSPLRYSPDATLTDKIAIELACAAASNSTHDAPGAMVYATFGLGSSVAARSAFLYLAQMSDPSRKANGVAALIGANDPSGVLELERHLHEFSETDLQLIAGLIYGSWRNPDLAATDSLGRIVTGPGVNPVLFRAVTTALCAIHTSATLPYLVQLLDSGERDAQIDGALGLSSFANGLPIHTSQNTANLNYLMPSAQSTFHTQATEDHLGLGRDAGDAQLKDFISFWKQWWQANQHVVLGQ